ncbi:MAG: hypothetical protein V1773_11900 [bacterium]
MKNLSLIFFFTFIASVCLAQEWQSEILQKINKVENGLLEFKSLSGMFHYTRV